MWKHKSVNYNGRNYDIVTRAYRDVISVMIYENSKISKMFKVQLYPKPGGVISNDLTLPHINPEPLLGSNSEDAVGQLYASVVASAIAKQAPDDGRKIIIGLGNLGPKNNHPVTKQDRDELEVVRQLVNEAVVW